MLCYFAGSYIIYCELHPRYWPKDINSLKLFLAMINYCNNFIYFIVYNEAYRLAVECYRDFCNFCVWHSFCISVNYNLMFVWKSPSYGKRICLWIRLPLRMYILVIIHYLLRERNKMKYDNNKRLYLTSNRISFNEFERMR